MAIKIVTFRIYPNKTQEKKLHYWRKLHKDLYNACVYNRKTQYKKFGHSVDYFEQQNSLPEFKEVWVEFKELGSHALQATVKRVDIAFQRFFKLKSGYPKFKSSRNYRGWTYPDKAGWKLESNGHHGFLTLSNLGRMSVRGKARDWGTLKTCTISFKQGKWFASITVECNPSRQTGTGAIGLDFGVNHAIADSNGDFVDNPRFLKNAQSSINKAAKKARRKRNPKPKVKPSRRWKKASRAVGKIQSKVARQRQDWQHKLSKEIVSVNSLVVTEQLNLKGMTKKAKKGNKRKKQKTGLNRSVLDVGIGNLKALIKAKVIEAGGVYIEVPTKIVKPSQTCSCCGFQKKKTLSERVHNCEKCGFTADRDVTSAQVMLNYARGTERASPDVDDSSSTSCTKYAATRSSEASETPTEGVAGRSSS